MKRNNDNEHATGGENTGNTADTKKIKLQTSLNLDNLGAGYDSSDKRISKAIEFYETKLLPFIDEHQSIFKKSNFISIKGYATDITTKQANAP